MECTRTHTLTPTYTNSHIHKINPVSDTEVDLEDDSHYC